MNSVVDSKILQDPKYLKDQFDSIDSIIFIRRKILSQQLIIFMDVEKYPFIVVSKFGLVFIGFSQYYIIEHIQY